MQARTRRWVRRAVIGVSAAAVFGAGLTVYLLRRPPAVWNQAQQILEQHTPEEREQQVDAITQRLVSTLIDEPESSSALPAFGPANEQAGFDQTAELELSNEELVALAQDMFDEWAGQRGYEVPTQITRPVVLAVDGRLAIAFKITTTNWSQVFSGYVELEFQPDGMAVGRVDGLIAGSLPVSVVEVGELLRKQLPQGEEALADRIGEWIAQLESFEFRPVLELEHRRRARVLAMAVGADTVALTMRVQDHRTYKRHNTLLAGGEVAVTDELDGLMPWLDGGALADVPATTE